MGFPNTVVGSTIEATIPLPPGSGEVQPSFKLHLSEKQGILLYVPNRHSTEKLLRGLEPKLRELAFEAGLAFASRNESPGLNGRGS